MYSYVYALEKDIYLDHKVIKLSHVRCLKLVNVAIKSRDVPLDQKTRSKDTGPVSTYVRKHRIKMRHVTLPIIMPIVYCENML